MNWVYWRIKMIFNSSKLYNEVLLLEKQEIFAWNHFNILWHETCCRLLWSLLFLLTEWFFDHSVMLLCIRLNLEHVILIPIFALCKFFLHKLLWFGDKLCSPCAVWINTLRFVKVFDLETYIFKIQDYVIQPLESHLFFCLFVRILTLPNYVAWETKNTEACFRDGASLFSLIFPWRAKLIIVRTLCKISNWAVGRPICRKVAIISFNLFPWFLPCAILYIERDLYFAEIVQALLRVQSYNV